MLRALPVPSGPLAGGLIFLAAAASAASAAPATAILDAGRLSDPVARYEYGMFIEPIGALIARSLWAEMLDDRKFYYAIVPEGGDAPAPRSVEGRPGITYRLRYSDFLKMSAFTTGVSTLDVTPTGAVLNSTGEVFKLYGDRFGIGTLPLTVEGDSPQPEPKYPAGFDHPKVRAGSATFPLDVIAGLSPDRKTLKIAIVNATLHSQSIMIEIKGIRTRGSGTVWRLTGEGLEATNKVGQPPGVTVRQSGVRALFRSLTVPPISTSVYEFPVAETHRGDRV